jgi:hypothetical protein
MICDPCKAGDHRNCEGGECQCQDRLNEKFNQELAKYVNASGDETLAEMIFSNLLYGGSEVTRMFAENAGKPAVKSFIQQVLRANRAAKC